MLNAPFLDSYRRRADKALSDGIADFNAWALQEAAIADSPVNFFGGDPLVDLAPTSPGGTPGSAATAPSGDTGATSTSLSLETATWAKQFSGQISVGSNFQC